MNGGTISHYEILEPLERGETGTVYRARDRRDGGLVAVVFLPVPMEAESWERLRRESEAAAALQHPHICPVLDLGSDPQGGPFVVRALEGETLGSRLERGPLSPEQAVGLASQVAAALGRAHEQGIVHRDLRPANVLVSADGQARVAGFGFSWVLVNGSSPCLAYRAPEQLRGGRVDARADVWALGGLLYEMITGLRPFHGAGQDLVREILEREPEPMSAVHPGLPSELDDIVAQALSKDPADRPARMDDLLVALRSIVAGGDLAEPEATLVQVPGLRPVRAAAEPHEAEPVSPAPAALPSVAVAHYLILEPLGGGAMGTVFKAEDTRLRRTVALKFLPGKLTRDPVAKARFLQEAQAASALDHPNICTIHEVSETRDGHLYLAMAAYEGETVKVRIERGQRPIAEAVDIACQTLQGLAKAHREGIVHRDVKPANLMVTLDGMVKILDFGVAKLRGATGMNVVGAFLGTPAYMSPEQARGEEVDSRSDVFSLGVVLYEMLAGARPFRSGEGVTTALRSLLEDRPAPLRTLRPEVPPDLERIVARMLAKTPADRYSTAEEVLSDLTSVQRALTAPPPRPAGRRVLLGSAAAVLAFSLAFAVWFALRPAPKPPPVRAVFTRLTEQEGRETYPTLAPDGLSFAYTKTVSGQKDIFLQRVDGSGRANLTEGSPADDDQPAISPDGIWVAFRSDRDGGGIYVVSVEGGAVRRISDLGHSPAWSPDGRELAVATEGIVEPSTRKADSQIWRVDVATGRRRLIVGDDGVQPSWSPNGWRIAYWGLASEDARRILWTVSANPDDLGDKGKPVPVIDDGFLNWNPVWSPDGAWLYFGSDRSGSLNLWRLPIDERTGEVRGEPEPVTTPSTASGFWSLSRDGRSILYAANESKANVESFSFDPERLQVTGVEGAVTRGSHVIRSCDISPDGQWIAFHAALPRDELFVMRLDGSGLRQLTDDPHKDRQPFWSPDGRRLLFYSNRGGSYEAWVLGIEGGEPERLLPPGGPQVLFPTWSPDGRKVAFTYGNDAAMVDLTRPRNARRVEPLAPAQDMGEFFYPVSWSPDGERLAGNMARLDGSLMEGIGLYSLRSRTYLRWTSRGFNPVWLRDGRRLLYAEAGKILAFDTITNEAREILAPPPYSAYDAPTTSPDGQTLFAVRAVDEGDIWLLTLHGVKQGRRR